MKATSFFLKAAELAPKRSKSRGKEKPLSIRLTAAARDHLRRMAGSRSLNGYVRDVLFDGHLTDRQRGRVPKRDQAILAQILGLLGKSDVFASLRALSRAGETGALPITDELRETLDAVCADIRLMRSTLTWALGLKVED